MTAPTGEIFALKSEAKVDEGKKLPPHLAKFFDKKGNLKPDAAKRIQKGRTKMGVKITDRTPKGYGPNEEILSQQFDETWWNDLASKMSQIRHPKGWDKMIKQYVDGMKDPDHRNNPTSWASDVARETRNVDGRQLIKYINRLVSQGKLPRDLRAQTEEKERQTFADLVKEINNKEGK